MAFCRPYADRSDVDVRALPFALPQRRTLGVSIVAAHSVQGIEIISNSLLLATRKRRYTFDALPDRWPDHITRNNRLRRRIKEIRRLRRNYGDGRWRKRKGVARVRLDNGVTRLAELHWYEATGSGRYEFKIKCFVDEP
jgi:hypothetical protein